MIISAFIVNNARFNPSICRHNNASIVLIWYIIVWYDWKQWHAYFCYCANIVFAVSSIILYYGNMTCRLSNVVWRVSFSGKLCPFLASYQFLQCTIEGRRGDIIGTVQCRENPVCMDISAVMAEQMPHNHSTATRSIAWTIVAVLRRLLCISKGGNTTHDSYPC